MWKKRLCLGLSDSFGVEPEEQIKLIKNAGFDAFFYVWEPEKIDDVARAGKEQGLIFQSLHAPFQKAADFWGDDEINGKAAVDELLACLKDCAKYEVPIMVVHAFIGFEDHNPTKTGLERFGIVVKEAQKCGVKIAFENTEGEEYLFALMEEFKGNDTVGFCWDSGHEMCYNHSKDLLAMFGDRLIATHLNDNLGISDFGGKTIWTDDLHLLPFDGIADWDYNAERLKKCGYDGILTFELTRLSKPNRHENDCYMDMPIEQYIAEAYKRACRVTEKIKQ